MSIVFGPVPSRRLGRSLGIDLIPHKRCTYDCIYCQVGRTTDKSSERAPWVALDDALAELKLKLLTKPDYITLSGYGEPTLHSQLAELITNIKAITNIPVAVITNGSLLWMPQVRKDLRYADLVIPSLDAADETTFQRINRPASDIRFDEMLAGLIAFGQEFTNQIWLEIFLLAGINDNDEQIEKIATLAQRIQPHKVQLNTISRPPAEDDAMAVSHRKLQTIAQRFTPAAEIIAAPTASVPVGSYVVNAKDVLIMLQRRSCTAEDIALGLGISLQQAKNYIEELAADGVIRQKRSLSKTYWQIV